jgi:Hg(II)-responsive transcriptional regulator
MTAPTLTIGRLARAADVNVETVRYYQARKLLPIPNRGRSAFRHYLIELVERIRFIKRAQELGFSLEEIRELLRLHDGTDRVSIRKIVATRLEQIESKLKDLTRMHEALSGLIDACRHAARAERCPIIQALAPRQQISQSKQSIREHL